LFTNNVAAGAGVFIPGPIVPPNPPPISTNITDFTPSNANGGAIWQEGGNLVIEKSRFETNRVNGGERSPVWDSCEAKGGAIYMSGGTIVISDVVFLRNIAQGGYGNEGVPSGEPAGGAVYFTNVNATVSGNFSENVVAGSGRAFPKGAGITVEGGSVLLTNVAMVSNRNVGSTAPSRHGSPTSDSGYGGAFYNAGDAQVWNSSFQLNYVSSGVGKPEDMFFGPGGHALGGAIYNKGQISILNTTLAKNTVQDSHFGFMGMAETNGGPGTAIFNAGGTAGVTNCTIVWNDIGTQAISSTNGTITLKNSILAFNTGINAGSNITDAGNNLSSDATPAFATSTSSNNTDPLIGPLGVYGGTTPCYPILAGSPAIDHGDDAAAPATDQRGRTRPYGAHSDIGSFESSAPFYIWGQVVGFHQLGTDIVIGTSTNRVSSDGTYSGGPYPAGDTQVSLSGRETLFRPNNFTVNLSADGPLEPIASYQIHTFVSDPVEQGTVFTLAGVPNEKWRIDSSTDLENWNSGGVVTLDSTGLYSIPATNSAAVMFFHPVQQQP